MRWSQREFPEPPVLSSRDQRRRSTSLVHLLSLSTAAAFTLFIALIVSPDGSIAEQRRRVHEVQSGENLSVIAQRYGLTVDELAAANDLVPNAPLSIGTELRIPRRSKVEVHVVRSGETAAQIARARGCTVSELVAYNKIGRRARLSVGQVLKIPPTQPSFGDRGRRRSKRRTHTIQSGESLNEIAHQYGLGTNILMRANRITNPRLIRPGRVLVIPDPPERSGRSSEGRVRPQQRSRRISGARHRGVVIHWTMDGQSWRSIARAYRTTIARLRKANPRLDARLLPGQPMRIPGAKTPTSVRVANCGYPGIRFQRRDKARTIRLFNCNGRVAARGRRQLSHLAGARAGRGYKLLNRKLLRRIQRIADEFPGRPIRIVSGYRAPRGERAGSRHNFGRALDFSLEGVSNRALWDFCRTLPSTGCGMYPNSSFVHVDYRRESARWIDRAGPGEEPDYVGRDRGDEDGPSGDSSDE